MTSDIQNLIQPIIGYYELGMFQDSLDTLGELPPAAAASREILAIKSDILTKLEAWDPLVEVAESLVEQWPDDAQFWISYAYATRRSSGIPQAEIILLEAATQHPEEPIIHFNLACYAAQQARLEDSRKHLDEAVRLDPDVKQMILHDPDLAPLREKEDSLPE